MSELQIYQEFIAWLGKTWWGLPDSERLLPLIRARYSVEEAAFLTGMPFSGNDLKINSPRPRCLIMTCASDAVSVFTNVRRVHCSLNAGTKLSIRPGTSGITADALWQTARAA